MEKMLEQHDRPVASEDRNVRDHKPKNVRTIAETISSLAGTAAFAAACYGVGNYFALLGPYDATHVGVSAIVSVVGSLLVLVANRYLDRG